MADSAPAKKTGSSSTPPVESTSGDKPRQKLTPGMSAPPGVKERRSRRVKRERRQGPFIKYVGHAAHRVIRAADWRSLGFTGKPPENGYADTTWGLKNDFLVESNKFTDEQLDYLLIDDVQGNGAHSFLEVDYNDNGQLVQVEDGEDEDDDE